MKKFILGVLVGGLIASAMPTYAAVSSLIGEEVAGEKDVTLNGETIGTAIIVDSKSYLPVRDTAEAIGAQVTPSSGVISLTIPLTNDAVESELYTLRTDKAFYEKEIEKLQKTAKNLEEVVIPQAMQRVELRTIESERQAEQARVDKFNESLTEQRQKIADYQAKLDYINARIAELEGQ